MKNIITWSIIIIVIFGLFVGVMELRLSEEDRVTLREDLETAEEYVKILDNYAAWCIDEDLKGICAVNSTLGTFGFEAIGPVDGFIGDKYVNTRFYTYACGRWNPEQQDFDVWFVIGI